MIAANSNAAHDRAGSDDSCEYVTVTVGDQLFGLPIERIHDVFIPTSMTPVPLAPPEIVGLLNLRGRVVTALCVRKRLGMPAREAGAEAMAVGLEYNGESYGLLVDSVGEVLRLSIVDGPHTLGDQHVLQGLSPGDSRVAPVLPPLPHGLAILQVVVLQGSELVMVWSQVRSDSLAPL